MFGYYLNHAHPLSMLDRLHDEMTRAMQPRSAAFAPRVALREEKDRYVLTADLPGIAPKDVEISATHDTVTLRAKRELTSPEGYKIHRQERPSLEFSRAFQLPATIDVDAVSAEIKDGILTLTLTKSPQNQPKTIAVRSA